jgi:hypothetical protein
MEVTIEYIMAAMIVLLIFTASEITINNLTTQRLAALEQGTGNTDAERILDTLLLSPGEPNNWGHNSSMQPTLMGLAYANAVKSYVLDPSKVARLSKNSTGYISPTDTRQMLGLKGNYQFTLEMTPLFDVEVIGNGSFTFRVKNSEGSLAPNVNVTAYYVPISLPSDSSYESKSNLTKIDGTCNLKFTARSGYALVIQTSQLGITDLATWPKGLDLVVEGGRVFHGDIKPVTKLEYVTGIASGSTVRTASRYAEISGLTYLVELKIWG